MVSVTSTLVTIATAVALLQMCPAPPAIVAAVAGGVAAGAVGGGASLCARYCPGPKARREARLPARDLLLGVSQESMDQCIGQINDQASNGGAVQISDVDQGSVIVTSVPPACMNLATVLTGTAAQAGGTVPVPIGSNSLQYYGLSGEDRQMLASALGAQELGQYAVMRR